MTVNIATILMLLVSASPSLELLGILNAEGVCTCSRMHPCDMRVGVSKKSGPFVGVLIRLGDDEA